MKKNQPSASLPNDLTGETQERHALGPIVLADQPIPKHIAIIMDGNGRWARKQHRLRIWGHYRGAEKVRNIVEAADNLGIKHLTLFAFSDENWGRPHHEIATIFALIHRYLLDFLPEMMTKRIRFKAIGDMEQAAKTVPKSVTRIIRDAESRTAQNEGINLNVAISYGARAEIAKAARNLALEVQKGNLKPEDITIERFSQSLCTRDIPDPDLLIRTSGELRISNFLLWQCAYSEFYFTPLFWPEFTVDEFKKAVAEFQRRNRRYGLLDEGDFNKKYATLEQASINDNELAIQRSVVEQELCQNSKITEGNG